MQHLSKDKTLKKILRNADRVELTLNSNIMLHLCFSIMSQQLSTKVATVIRQRFLALFGRKKPTAAAILDLPFTQLKGIGLSNSKTMYIQNVCRFFQEQKLNDRKIQKMSDEEVIDCLTQIKGVGRWTVEMILMFALGREDVFAVDDLGIQQQITCLYNLDGLDRKNLKLKMIGIAENWRPYRTYACMYLWKAKDA